MRLIGLTGGIASGKSTVSAIFRQLGARVLDADQLAREVVRPGSPGLKAVEARFPGVVKDGQLDRAALASRIFGDAAQRSALNAILHPLIQERFAQRTAELEKAGERLVLYDAALLIENGLHERMDGVILVAVPEAVQLQRLIARDGLSLEAARARLAAQMPLEEKKKVATWVVDNAGPPEQTRAQVERIWSMVRRP